MAQKRRVDPHQKAKMKHIDETPFTTRFLMAMVGLAILLALYYFFNGEQFPSDISYENLR